MYQLSSETSVQFSLLLENFPFTLFRRNLIFSQVKCVADCVHTYRFINSYLRIYVCM